MSMYGDSHLYNLYVYIYIIYIINIQKIMLNPATKMGFPTQISPGDDIAAWFPGRTDLHDLGTWSLG
jgi:hypothetical protein